MKILFPSWTRYCVWGVEGNAGIEVVKDFVDLLDLIVGRSYASETSERYLRRERHALGLGRCCLPDGRQVGRPSDLPALCF